MTKTSIIVGLTQTELDMLTNIAKIAHKDVTIIAALCISSMISMIEEEKELDCRVSTPEYRSLMGAIPNAMNTLYRFSMRGSVYFIQAELTKNIKIGFSNNVRSRLQQLQTSASEPLTVLAIKSECTQEDEYNYHQMFSASRVRGEWFSPSQDILDEIERIQAL